MEARRDRARIASGGAQGFRRAECDAAGRGLGDDARGAELADAKYRSSEKRRAVDVGVLSRELREHEASGVALLAEQQLTALRLHADAKCAATEIRELEADHEEELLAMAAEAEGREWRHARRVEEAEEALRGVEAELAAESSKLIQVTEALRAWEAADHAERLRTLTAAEAVELRVEEMARALATMRLPAPSPSPPPPLSSSSGKSSPHQSPPLENPSPPPTLPTVQAPAVETPPPEEQSPSSSSPQSSGGGPRILLQSARRASNSPTPRPPWNRSTVVSSAGSGWPPPWSTAKPQARPATAQDLLKSSPSLGGRTGEAPVKLQGPAAIVVPLR